MSNSGFDPSFFTITPNQMKRFLVMMLKSEKYIPTIFIGPPGIGKTHIIYDACQTVGYRVVDRILTAQDPVDVSGIPHPVTHNDGSHCFQYLAEEAYYEASTKIPDGPPMVLFYDDIAAAEKQVLCAFFKVVHERKVGTYKLRDNVRILAAANRADDNAGANDMPTALNNRFLFRYLKTDTDEWVEWAIKKGLHPIPVGFLQANKQYLHQFDPNSTNPSFASPRSWHMLSDLYQVYDAAGEPFDFKAGFGLVGEIAKALEAYASNARSAVPIEEILEKPTKARVPSVEELDVLFATITNLQFWVESHPKDWKKIAIYASRPEMTKDLAMLAVVKLVKTAINDQIKGNNVAENVQSEELMLLYKTFGQDLASINELKEGLNK